MSVDVYDLCIIGAGMFGSAAARHASVNPAIKVCLIGPEEPKDDERKNREIFASHYDEGRITRILCDDPPLEILSKRSIQRYRELENLSGINFYSPVGFICVGKKDGEFMKRMVGNSSICDTPVTYLPPETFRMRYPFLKLKEDDQVILDDIASGYISPRKMVKAQKKVAAMQGCYIVNDTVEEVKPLTDGIHEVLTGNKRIMKAKRILLCTGAFTNFKNFSIPRLSISVEPETAVLIKIPDAEVRRLSCMPCIVYVREEDKIGAYMFPAIQYPDGGFYLKIGHLNSDGEEKICLDSLDKIKQWYLSEGNPRRVKHLTKILTGLIPDLKMETASVITCVTCYNPNKVPYIDRVTPTISVAVVGNGRGAKFSDEVGRIAACLTLTGKWDSELLKDQFEIIKI